MNQKTKRVLSGVGAAAVALALLIGGTYAYTAFDHRSNPLRNAPDYQGRLVEDYEEKEWEVDEEIKKEISVKNMGGTAQFPGSNWGDIYVRVKLKEHMDITPIEYIYYPEDEPEEKVRFMTDKEGSFVRFAATGANTLLTAAQLTNIRASDVWEKVIDLPADRAAFVAALAPANFIRLCGCYDSQDYWYVVTRAGDPNGQYGSFVVVDQLLDVTRMESVTGSDRATGINYGSGLYIQDPSEHDNEECLYPTHYWDEDEPELCGLDSHGYAKWDLGPSIVMIADWDGLAIDAWILNPDTGWATWGNALKPGESTDLLLQSVTPIRMPDGDMLYVIHADLQCTDRMDMLRDDFWKDDDGNDDPWDIEGIVSPKATGVSGVSIAGGNRSMTVGQTEKLKAVVQPGNATNKGVQWSSSNPGIVTVDADGNIEAKAAGTATITVTTDDGGFTDTITVTVAPATVPATGINVTTASPMTIEVGQTLPIAYTVVPANTTDTAGLSVNNGNVSIVSATQIKGEAVGTSIVTITAGSVTKTVTVNVVAAPVPGTGVSINLGDDVTIAVGEEQTLAITKTPSNTTDTPAWTSSDAGKVTVDQTGKIKGIAPGTAVVTVTLRPGVTDTITVTVVPAADPVLPIQGSGTYDMNPDDSLSYFIMHSDFNNPISRDQDGTIKLSDIIHSSFGANYSSVSVTAVNPALASMVSKGVKNGNDVIVLTYYGTAQQWLDVNPQPFTPPLVAPQVPVAVVLSAPGYADTTVTINMAFDGMFIVFT